MNDQKIRKYFLLVLGVVWFSGVSAQRDTVTLGYGGLPVNMTVSSSTPPGNPQNTMNQNGFFAQQKCRIEIFATRQPRT